MNETDINLKIDKKFSEVQTVFQRTDDSWHDAGSFADFQFFGETSRGQICEIGKLNDRNKDRSLNKLVNLLIFNIFEKSLQSPLGFRQVFLEVKT